MFKRVMVMLLVGFFMFSAVAPVSANVEKTLMEKLKSVEVSLYGSEQTGAIMDRITQAETFFYGETTAKSMIEKVDFLYDNIFYNVNGQASALTKANAIEWTILHTITTLPLKVRVENLENLIEGGHRTGSLQERMLYLANLAFANGEINLVEQAVPADTLVKIKLLTPITSKQGTVGEKIKYCVAEDVIVGDTLVFTKGSEGIGEIIKLSRSQNFGRDGQVEVDFKTVLALGGEGVPVFLGEKAQQRSETIALAAGATIAGLVVLGPVGIVTGAFVKGKEVNIPADTEMYIQTKTEVTVLGIKMLNS